MVKQAALISLFLFTLAFLSATAKAGDFRSDLEFVMEHRSLVTDRGHESFSSFFTNETRETRLALMGAMRLYQIFISSQDMSACIFTPSCSRFGMRAVSEFGPIHGGLMAADRLLRCHGTGKRYYPLNLKTSLSLDYPVDYYYIKYNAGKARGCVSGICSDNNHDHDEGGK